MRGMFFDETYLILIPAMIFALFAQINVKSTFNKYSRKNNSRGLTGAEIARQILDANGLYNVRIEHISGSLTDHFSPNENVVRLSDDVYGKSTIASAGVAAHEVGHAIQHSVGYAPIKIRNAIIPITQIGSSISMPIFIIGIALSFKPLVTAGILLFSAVVFFQLITLPVEFNASRRALKTLESKNILEGDELKGSAKVLRAAAMTYLAGLFSSLASLIRLIAISNRRN